MPRFLQLLVPIVVAVKIASSVPAQAAPMRVKEAASAQELNTLKLVLKVQVNAGTGARQYSPGDRKSVAPETAPEEGVIHSETTGTLEGCIASWDRGTHMTNDEWRNACKRVMDQRASKPKHD